MANVKGKSRSRPPSSQRLSALAAKTFFLTEARETVGVGLPLVAAQLLQMSMGFVDTVMAGRLSAGDLAAVAVGFSLVGPVLVFAIGVLMATNPIVAQLHGAGRDREIGRNLWQSLWLSQMVALPAFFLLREMHVVLQFMETRPEIIPVARDYLRAFSWGLPAACAYFSLRFFNEGLTVTKPSMYLALLGLMVNAAGNYVFMYGHLGFPALGAVGTGWASALVWWVMFLGMVGLTFRQRAYARFELWQGLARPAWLYIRRLLHVGLPNGLSVTIEVSMFALAGLIISSLGVQAVAGHQIALNFAAFTFMLPLGLSIATTARVGFAVGQGDLRRARRIGYVGIALGTAVMVLTAGIMFAIPERIVAIYTRDPEVSDVAVQLIFLAAVFQISDGVQVSVLGALRGLKDTKVPMLFNAIAYWLVGLPTGYVLALPLGYGAAGLWVGMIAGLTVAAVLHNWRFHRLTAHVFAGQPTAVERPTALAEWP